MRLNSCGCLKTLKTSCHNNQSLNSNSKGIRTKILKVPNFMRMFVKRKAMFLYHRRDHCCSGAVINMDFQSAICGYFKSKMTTIVETLHIRMSSATLTSGPVRASSEDLLKEQRQKFFRAEK